MPIFAHAASVSLQAGKINYTVQKKHSLVVDKAMDIFSADMRNANGKKGALNVALYQLDMASNKDMKALGALRIPLMDFIAKPDAYWLGVRGGKVIVVGSNGRGTAYGLLHLTRLGKAIDDNYETTEKPTVDYRGVDIESERWSAKDYHHLFALMLRMRGNVVLAGWDKGETDQHTSKMLRNVADSFGIDLATAHGNSLRLHGHKKDAQTIDLAYADDGYGYIAPVPDADDDADGIIYHLSYAGKPYPYLWLSATQPGLMFNEMSTAYDRGAKKLWTVAIHDPNVAAYQLSLFMDMAWDIEKVRKTGVQGHLRNWLSANFGKSTADVMTEPLTQYFKLTGICRPEFMGKAEFNAEEFGNELERYINDYRDVCKKVDAAAKLVDNNKKEFFSTSIEYPVIGSALMAEKTLQAQESRLIGRPASFHIDEEALESAARSMKAYEQLLVLTADYNKIMAQSHWDLPIDTRASSSTVFAKPVFTDTVSAKEVEKYYSADPVAAPLQDDGCIVRNAFEYTSANGNTKQLEMTGRSMKAIEMQKDATLTFNFSTNVFGGVLRLAFIPTYDLGGGSSQCEVSIDGGKPTTIIVNDASQSDQWGKAVLRGQSVVTLPLSLQDGSHKITIKALNDHVVFDQLMIDRDADRLFFVFPKK